MSSQHQIIPNKCDCSEIIERIIKMKPQRRQAVVDDLVHLFDKQPRKKIAWTRELVLSTIEKTNNKYNKRHNRNISRSSYYKIMRRYPHLYPSMKDIDNLFATKAQPDGWLHVMRELKIPVVRMIYDKRLLLCPDVPKDDVMYYIHLYRQLGLKNMKLYNEAHRKYPEVVPSMNSLIKTLGNFKTLKRIVRLDDCNEQLTKLLSLMESLGKRWPRKGLCRQHGVDRAYLERRLGGRQELEELCRKLLSLKFQEEKKDNEKSKGR